MITETLLGLFKAVLLGFSYLLPDWDAPELSDGLAAVMVRIEPVLNLAAGLNQYVPLTEALLIVTLTATMYSAGLIYSGVVWLLSKMHVLGGASQ